MFAFSSPDVLLSILHMGKRRRPGRLEFGGRWTSIKLAALESYLPAYTTIFTKNPAARHFSTMYVDAFAGTGRIAYMPDQQESLFADREEYVKGSAARALEVKPEFDRYIFIESDPARYAALGHLKITYPDKMQRIELWNEEANLFLTRWCTETDWNRWRAVVLLDPFCDGRALEHNRSIGQNKGCRFVVALPLWRFQSAIDERGKATAIMA